ncbi:MAG: hypothetical protein ACYSX0_07275 [Planctomycetota bacterium]|jgi:hypothetical protein
MNRRWPWIAALFLLTLLVHSKAGKGEFLFFDDARFVVRNPSIDAVGNPLRFFTDLETTASPDAPTRDIYRPIRTLSYAVISEGWSRESAGPFHALAILLHAGTTALLALLLLTAGLSLWPALAGALFWGLHPVNVEVTAWVCSLGDAWCGFFSILAVLWYAKDRPILAYVAFVLALFSKEHALVVPGIWVAWDFYLRPERPSGGGLVRALLPGLAIIVAFLLFRDSLGVKMSQVDEPLGGSHFKAVLTMLKGLGFYTWTILVPFQSTFQKRIEVPASYLDASVLAGLAVLAVLLFGLFRGPRRTRLASAWFLMALIPASNLFVTLKIPTADRFLYLPLMGASFAVGEICQRLKRPVAYAVPLLLVLLGILTSVRIGDFRSDESLLRTWERVSPKDPKLIWAQAAEKAQRAVLTMDTAGFAQSRALVADALHHYELFVRNAAPEETTQIWMEMGELQLAWGGELRRLGYEDESLDALRAARNSFRAAHALQVQGVGRVVPIDVRRAAEMAASLSIRLALPESKKFGDDVKTGLAMLDFLEAEFGDDVEMQRAQLWFLTARQRRYEPARVRPILLSVLDTLGKLAKEGRPNPYLRAQALLVLSVLKDRPIDRPGLDEAYDLFLEASRQSRQIRLQALFHAAQTRRIVGRAFGEAGEVDRARVILDRIPKVAEKERLRVTLRLRRLIEVEKSECASR